MTAVPSRADTVSGWTVLLTSTQGNRTIKTSSLLLLGWACGEGGAEAETEDMRPSFMNWHSCWNSVFSYLQRVEARRAIGNIKSCRIFQITMTVTDLQEQKTPLSLYTTNVKPACFRGVNTSSSWLKSKMNICIFQRLSVELNST